MAPEEKDKFVFFDEEDRPVINKPTEKPRYTVGKKVRLILSDGSFEGPFLIASVISVQKFTLCFEDGQPAKDGEEISVSRLEAA